MAIHGWVMNGANDQLAGPDGYGVAQLIFSTYGRHRQRPAGTSTLHYGTDLPVAVNTWQKFEVDAQPLWHGNRSRQVAHVGQLIDTGSMWWDDVALYQVTSFQHDFGSRSACCSGLVAYVDADKWSSLSNSINSDAYIHQSAVIELYDQMAGSKQMRSVMRPIQLPSRDGTRLTAAPRTRPRLQTHAQCIGALRLSDTATAVPVAWQGSPTSINIIPATPWTVWDETGFGYVWSSDPTA